MKVKSLGRVRLFVTPWTAAHQAPPPMGFSRQEYWSGVPLPSPDMVYRYIKMVIPTPIFSDWQLFKEILLSRECRVAIKNYWEGYFVTC